MTYEEWCAKFWARVLRLSSDKCWLWLGFTKRGYGQLKRADGSHVFAHRASLEITYNLPPIPSDKVVMHLCDNPPCVNPAHLRIATQADNVKDMGDKGRKVVRARSGERHPSAVLSALDVEELKRCWENRKRERWTQGKLAERFGVSQAQISRILTGKRWNKRKPP